MRFDVPQFIEIEDKIFGPLTWRQFVYLGGGGGAVVALVLLLPLYIAIIPAVIIGGIAAALAFFPVNNRPFSYFLEAIFNYLTRDKLYLWHQKADVVYKQSTTKTAVKTPTVRPENRGTKHKSITSLTRSLELQAMQKPEQ